MKNPVVHFEIAGNDHESLQAYYPEPFRVGDQEGL